MIGQVVWAADSTCWMQGALSVNLYSYVNFMNATTKLVICTISVSFIYIWSHVEDFMVIYVPIKPFIT